jgi:hypothetical protein
VEVAVAMEMLLPVEISWNGIFVNKRAALQMLKQILNKLNEDVANFQVSAVGATII